MIYRFGLFILEFLGYFWYFLVFLVLMPWASLIISYRIDWLLFNKVLAVSLNLTAYPVFTQLQWLLTILFLTMGSSLIIAAVSALTREAQFFPFPIIEHAHLNPKKLVRAGVYGLIRHPMILGYFFLFEAVAVLAGSTSMFIWINPLLTALILEYTLLTEEPRLAKWFGEEYEDYCRRVPAIIPRFEVAK